VNNVKKMKENPATNIYFGSNIIVPVLCMHTHTYYFFIIMVIFGFCLK